MSDNDDTDTDTDTDTEEIINYKAINCALARKKEQN